MEDFTLFGRDMPPMYSNNSSSFMPAKEKAAQAKAAKLAAADKEKKDAENKVALQARDMANVKAGLEQINATHGLKYNSNTGSYTAGKRRKPTRRLCKTKSKRRKTRRRH